MKSLKIIGALAACILSLATARAQTATPSAESTTTGAANTDNPAAAAPPVVEEVVITGSRLVRDGSQAPTPVTAVTFDALTTQAPSNFADALKKLPQFSGSTNQYSAGALNANSVPAGNFLNLRGLGSQRLLVLLDGQRVPPTSNTNAVDTNIIPQLLVSRIDVVTGGASAIYGSDAVSGVVNYVLNDRFEGLKLLAQDGISTHGDAHSYRFGGAVGTQFGSRLHVIGSYEHYKNEGIPSIFDRSWTVPSGTLVGGGTATSPYQVVDNARRNNLTNGGLVLSGALAGYRFQPDGSLTPFVPGTPTLSSLYNVGGDGGIWADRQNGGISLAASLKTDQAFGRAAYDLSDDMQFIVSGIYTRSETGINGVPTNSAFGAAGANRRITIYSDNPYLRPEVVAQLNAAGESTFSVGRIYNDVRGIRQESVTDFTSGQAGLEGKFGNSWKWGVHYVYGKAVQDVDWNEFSSRNYFAALDAVRDPATGNIVCGVTLRNPSLLPGCVPVNILGEGNISQAAFDFIREDSRYRIANEMQYVTADIRGDIFELPAGPVAFAGSVEWRRQTLSQTSNSDPAVWSGPNGPAERAAYFSGIRGVPSSALIFTSINVGQGAGTQTVKEASGELLIPVFRDKPFARNLDFNLAARSTDYKTSGSVVSWKAGGTWTPVDAIRFRANQSRDIAAPSLFNLFAGQNLSITTLVDPLTGQSVVVPIATAGNPNLEPEFADTTTLGFVLTPLPRLTVAIDAYRVSIEGAIQTQSASDQLATCAASGGTSSVCDLIIRPFPYSNTSPANVPTLIRVLPQNLASLVTRGLDFEVNYLIPLDSVFPSIGGTLGLRAFANYLDSYKTQGSGERVGYTAAISDSGPPLVGLPRIKGLLSQTYSNSNDDLSFTLSERFTGRYRYGLPTQTFVEEIVAPNRTYVDANVTVNFGSRRDYQFFLNVQNLFDKSPPRLGATLAQGLTTATDATAYDVVGRYFTAGLRLGF